MRIVHYIERIDLSIGGTVRAALDMCAGLARLGHEVTLATLNDADVPASWRAPGAPGAPGASVRVVCLGEGTGLLGRLGGAQREALRGVVRGADVLHIHAVWDLTNTQAAAVARAEGVAYVVSPHGMLDDWAMAQKRAKKLVYLRLGGGRRLLDGAGALHFASASEAEQSPRWAPRTPPCMIPLLFDASDYARLPGPERARERWGLAVDGPPILGFLSRLTSGKRADLVIRAAGELRRRGTTVRLVIAGGDAGEESRLRSLAEAEGVADLTAWPGAVYGEDKVSLYQAMDVFALPSDHENFCFALVEAMAAGTPAATVRTVGIWREASSSGGCVVCEPDPGALAEAVEPWLRDVARREAAGRAARSWVLESLNIDRVASEYVRMYQRVQRSAAG